MYRICNRILYYLETDLGPNLFPVKHIAVNFLHMLIKTSVNSEGIHSMFWQSYERLYFGEFL